MSEEFARSRSDGQEFVQASVQNITIRLPGHRQEASNDNTMSSQQTKAADGAFGGPDTGTYRLSYPSQSPYPGARPDRSPPTSSHNEQSFALQSYFSVPPGSAMAAALSHLRIEASPPTSASSSPRTDAIPTLSTLPMLDQPASNRQPRLQPHPMQIDMAAEYPQQQPYQPMVNDLAPQGSFQPCMPTMYSQEYHTSQQEHFMPLVMNPQSHFVPRAALPNADMTQITQIPFQHVPHYADLLYNAHPVEYTAPSSMMFATPAAGFHQPDCSPVCTLRFYPDENFNNPFAATAQDSGFHNWTPLQHVTTPLESRIPRLSYLIPEEHLPSASISSTRSPLGNFYPPRGAGRRGSEQRYKSSRDHLHDHKTVRGRGRAKHGKTDTVKGECVKDSSGALENRAADSVDWRQVRESSEVANDLRTEHIKGPDGHMNNYNDMRRERRRESRRTKSL